MLLKVLKKFTVKNSTEKGKTINFAVCKFFRITYQILSLLALVFIIVNYMTSKLFIAA